MTVELHWQRKTGMDIDHDIQVEETARGPGQWRMVVWNSCCTCSVRVVYTVNHPHQNILWVCRPSCGMTTRRHIDNRSRYSVVELGQGCVEI